MTSPAFATLLHAYQHRLAVLDVARAAGQPCVGYVGNTVPVELIAACGALPLRIAPVNDCADAAHTADATQLTSAADTYIEPFADPDVRRIFALYVQGALDALALLVIPRSSESWHKLYLALREATRIGLKGNGPPLVLYEILHTQRESSHAYGLARTHELAARLAVATGKAADASSLRAAIAQGNHTRLVLQQLQALRQQGRINGWQAQVVTGALRFLAPAAGQSALKQWLTERHGGASIAAHDGEPAASSATQRPRLFVQGVALDHAELHAAVDAAGARVVMEDDDWGSRAATPLIDQSLEPFTAVFEYHWREVPNLRIHPPPSGPEAFISAHAQGQIDGVIFYVPRPDDVHGWRLPALRAQADAAAVPWLLLRDDARDTATRAQLAQQLRDFVQSLASGHQASRQARSA